VLEMTSWIKFSQLLHMFLTWQALETMRKHSKSMLISEYNFYDLHMPTTRDFLVFNCSFSHHNFNCIVVICIPLVPCLILGLDQLCWKAFSWVSTFSIHSCSIYLIRSVMQNPQSASVVSLP
jgi:hypothetical protein